MGAVNDAHSLGNIVDVIDKDRAFFGEFVDYVTIVHNFFANVDRSAKGIEGYIHHIDRTHHTGTETARFEEQNLLFAAAGRGVGGGIDVD